MRVHNILTKAKTIEVKFNILQTTKCRLRQMSHRNLKVVGWDGEEISGRGNAKSAFGANKNAVLMEFYSIFTFVSNHEKEGRCLQQGRLHFFAAFP